MNTQSNQKIRFTIKIPFPPTNSYRPSLKLTQPTFVPTLPHTPHLPSISMNEAIRTLTRQIHEIETKNQQEHYNTQLLLSTVINTLRTATSTISDLQDRILSTQRAVILQSMERGLLRNLADLKTNKVAVQMKLLSEMDNVKRKKTEENRRVVGSNGGTRKRTPEEHRYL